MSTDNGTVLAALHADLELLKNAIEAEDHTAAEQLVQGHAVRLRDYLQAHGAGTQLQALLEQQQALTLRMRQLRDEAAQYLRQERQSVRAANAYQQAGSLT